jgi:ribosome-binding factor A
LEFGSWSFSEFMNSHRIEKIESLMLQTLGQMIEREFAPPAGALVSLTKVAASGNLQEAKVYVSVIPDRELDAVVAKLEKIVWEFQQELNKKLKMRPVPKIIFVADRQPAQAQEVETILEQLKKS